MTEEFPTVDCNQPSLFGVSPLSICLEVGLIAFCAVSQTVDPHFIRIADFRIAPPSVGVGAEAGFGRPFTVWRDKSRALLPADPQSTAMNLSPLHHGPRLCALR